MVRQRTGAAPGAELGAARAHAESDADAEALALAFGAAVRGLRLQAGFSLNQLARRAGVDPPTSTASRLAVRSGRPLPRRAVVSAIAAALGSDAARPTSLLALAGHTPAALLELGGWDDTLASVAELLADPSLSGPAEAEFREIVRILSRRWAWPEPKLE